MNTHIETATFRKKNGKMAAIDVRILTQVGMGTVWMQKGNARLGLKT